MSLRIGLSNHSGQHREEVPFMDVQPKREATAVNLFVITNMVEELGMEAVLKLVTEAKKEVEHV
jgi:hypothetical protein